MLHVSVRASVPSRPPLSVFCLLWIAAAPRSAGAEPPLHPAVLASGQSGIYGLATDGEHLVWRNRAGELVGVFAHGGPVRRIAADQPGEGPLTLSAGRAYYALREGAIVATKLRNGGVKRLVDADALDRVGVRGDILYFVTPRHASVSPTPAELMQVSASRGGAARMVARLPAQPEALAFDSAALWMCAGGGLHEIMLDDGAVEARSSGVPCGVLALDGDAIYAMGDKRLVRVPRGGGAPEVLAQGVASIALAPLADRVFFIDGERQILASVPTAGGAPTAVVAVAPTAGQLVAARGSLYWAEGWACAAAAAPAEKACGAGRILSLKVPPPGTAPASAR
jgi:hypothetical protein